MNNNNNLGLNFFQGYMQGFFQPIIQQNRYYFGQQANPPLRFPNAFINPRPMPFPDARHPIQVDSDSDDDDVEFIPRPPTPPLQRRLLKIGANVFDIPVIPDDVVNAYREALRIAPEIIKWQLTGFLEQVLRAKKPVDDTLVDRIVMEGTNPHGMASLGNYQREAMDIIGQLFPSAHKADLRGEVTKYGIVATYRQLKNAPLVRQIKTPRPARTLVVKAIPHAIDLMDIEQDEKKEMDKIRKQRAYQLAEKAHELLFCGCCWNQFLDEDMAQCSNGHLFCRKCLIDHIETLVGEGRSDLRCLSVEEEECNGCVPMSELERVVPVRTLERLFATETENAVINSDVQGLVKCHHCGIRIEVDGSGIMRCPECGSETCTGCGQAGHKGMSCEEFAGLDKNRLVEDKMSEAVIRTCPRCDARFMKEEGCNKMECPRCHTWICYLCRKEIPKDVGYAHFWRYPGPCPPDRCPLWVRNDTLHRIEAVQAQERTQSDLHDT